MSGALDAFLASFDPLTETAMPDRVIQQFDAEPLKPRRRFGERTVGTGGRVEKPL